MRLAACDVAGVACRIAAALALAACSSTPPPPDWQMNAKGALERSVAAYLAGNSRVERVEFERARAEIARTGQPVLLARAELTRCATRVASLVFEPCAGFDALAMDASDTERAYAAFLMGQGAAGPVESLPAQYRGVAVGNITGASLAALPDPLSRLIAAAAALRTGRAAPDVLAAAVTTASAQGWSRPLLAWLNAQLLRAEAGNDVAEATRLRRRIALVLDAPAAVAAGAASGTAAASAP